MSKSIWVSVDLDDMDTDDLMDELEKRYLDERDKNILMSIIEDNDPKIKLFMQVREKYSIFELEEMFGDKTPQLKIPENQLKLL
jgi:hypothetical protein